MKSNLLKSIFISLILVMGVSNAWAATIFNCGIEVNETWYKGTGTINSGNWLENKTAFNNKDFGVITSLKLGGQYDTWDNGKTDNCSWNASNGITITIKKGSTQKDQFKLSCYNSGKDGNNNVWKTTGTIGTCGDKDAYGRYTHSISQYAAGNDYTIAAKWFSPSGISTTATAKFTIPGFTTTSKSQAFDNTQVNHSSSQTISFGTHYGTALKTSNCSISGTNASEFSVTSINESGVTVQFNPTSAGDKTATLTITDAHSKTCTITLSGNAQSPTPSITISTTQQYLQIGEDKLTLTINYTNIPEGHCYRVKVGDGYYNGNANGENNDHVSISGSGSVAFTTYSTLPGGTQSIVVELWKSNPFSATSTKSNAINVTVEQGYQVSVYTRIGSTNTPTGTTISPTEHIGKTITATEMSGYAFTGWTSNTTNITFEDESASSTLVYAISGGDIYANYTKETCVYFINTSNWSSVYAYAWNGGGNNGNWPGVTMTKTDETIGGYDVYKYCPIESYDNLIFNNNSGTQTGDLVWEDGKYYCAFGVHGNFFVNKEWKTTNFSSVSNDGTSASLTLNINAGSYEFGMKVPDWTSNGSSFSRADNSKVITSGNGNCNFTADITGEYTFTWTFATNTLTITYPQLVTYTVTFNMKGHGTQIEQIEVNKDSKITKPKDPTATGYTFGGWYKDDNCNTAWNFNTDVVTANTTLYAKWTPTTYNITYKDQGDKEFSGIHENGHPTQHTYATDTQLKGAGKMGYTFLGWHTDAACNNKVTILGATAYTANITLYAKWETRNLYIHADFVNNWGTPAQMTQDENNKAVYTYTTTLEAKAGSQVSPYHDGYHFRVMNAQNGDNQYLAYNWPNVQTPTGTNIDGPHLTDPGNQTIQFGLARRSEVTITLTLQSSNDNPKPTVEINANPYYTITRSNPTNGTYTIQVGTNEAVSTNTESFADKTITLSASPNPGYHFVEWTVTKNSGGTTITVTDNTFTMPAEDVTVAATFAATTYDITYHLNGGEGAANSTYTVESAAITLPIPTKTGYTFGGWFDNENCTGTAITTIAAGSTEDKTFYAKWTANRYTVTLDQTDATTHGVPSIEVTYDTEMPSIAEQLPKRTGYYFGGYFTEKNGSGTQYYNQEGTAFYNKKWDITSDTQLYIKWIANNYTVIFNANGGTGTMENQKFTYDIEQALNNNTFTRTGYTFAGWNTKKTGDGEPYKNQEEVKNLNSTKDGQITIYAQWTANTYTVTLDQTGATTQGTEEVTATYDADMPSATMPTKTGYVFGGYYDQQNGQGTQYYYANGASARTWNKAEDNTTLYAYFVTPQIEVTLNGSTFEPGTASVTATATVTPAPADGTTVICWSLLYSGSENEVAGHEPTPTNGNSVQFSISDLAAGSYTIKAILREGTGCEGTEISSATKTFLITSSHTITIKYTCDGKEIQASTTQEAQVSSATTITAPDIFGYTFSEWEAGDGVEIKTTSADKKTITYTAYYDGNLTATYTKNENIIYFYNTLGWENVYVYFYNGNYWEENYGTGTKNGSSCTGYAKMTQITGTDIWYVNASGKNTTYLAFCKDLQNNEQWFYNTSVARRGDYNSKLPMFVPIADQNPEIQNQYTYEGKNYKTKYYNKGYWMNYPENTGYKLQIYDGTGNGAKEVASVRFPYSTNTIMPLTVSVDLEAGKTYGFKILREDNTYFSNSGTMTANSNGWSFTNDVSPNCGLKTTLAGDYTFTLKYAVTDQQDPNNYKYCVDVVYPVSVGDYRVIYKDNAKWSQTTAHGANWYHPSYAIKKNSSATEKTDIVSFFIAKDNNPTMKFQKCTAINGQIVTWADVANGAITIPDDVVTAAGVYNFIVKQPAGGASISVESVEPYTGNYYIRVDAMDGKWGNYKTDPDNRMTYSAFSESEANSFGEKYSHYVTKYCPYSTNIKFTIANDYSPCISDTLVRDFGANNTVNPFGNLDENGTLIKDGGNNDKYSANVRFMWNHKTNKISRAYIGRAVTNDFLVIDGNKTLHNSKGAERDTIVFFDTQNWIYEVKMKVQPTTRVKVYAAYPAGVGESKAQYFCGAYNNDAFNNDEDSKLALGGDANDQNYYSIRVLYDFKTNRLLMAWMPSGDTENVDGTKTISADVMLIRDHQNPAQCITFANEDSKLSEVKTVYGSMRFNRWVLNNRGGQNNFDVNSCGGADSYDENTTNSNHPVLQPAEQKSQYERALYFISFPFDVNVSDIFGFGTYGQHWIIEYYDGLKRAREGYWIDSDPNWKYVTNPDEFVLEKYKGYILCLNLSKMAYNNTDFWAHNISQVELFFPSTTTMSEIKRTEVTMPELGDEYLCKINRNTPEGDRRVKDSYWRCIGVPSYANYSNILTDGEQQPITWQTSYTTFPFLYAWNMTDNTLTPQSTNRFNFKTMHAYLVQNGGEIHWSAVSATPNQPSNIVARRQAADEVKNYEWKLTLSRNEQIEDQAFVRLSDNEQVTTEFDFNQDLSKEFNYGRSDIYTLIGYEKAAANSLPITETTTLIPLGLSIEYNGDYTIAMPDRMENIGVTLIDTESNTRTNLSAGMEYVVTLNKGDYNNRFFIEISPAHQVPTDIEYVTGDSNNQDSVRKVLIDNILYIVRDGQIFDARGARVK